MNLRRVLIFVVILDALLNITAETLCFLHIYLTPDYFDIPIKSQLEISPFLAMTQQVTYYALLVVSYIGLVLLWRPSRWLFVFSWCYAQLPFSFTTGVVSNALGNFLTTIMGVTD